MPELTTLFCDIDDFCSNFEDRFRQQLIESGEKKRNRKSQLCSSEIITIVVLFHQTGFRNFKQFYVEYVCVFLRKEFPNLLSYNRFVTLMPSVFLIMFAYLNSKKAKQTGIAYIDSTKLSVCQNIRISRNKVFAGIASIGKTSTGWFFGLKLHIIVNEIGEVLSFAVTTGSVSDLRPVKQMSRNLVGKLFGDRGYISKKLFENLLEQGLKLITTIRKNMKNRLLPIIDKILLRKRFIIETINDQLKNISQIEHSRHRSINNFFVNLFAGLIAYVHQEKKPSINFGNYGRLTKKLVVI